MMVLVSHLLIFLHTLQVVDQKMVEMENVVRQIVVEKAVHADFPKTHPAAAAALKKCHSLQVKLEQWQHS